MSDDDLKISIEWVLRIEAEALAACADRFDDSFVEAVKWILGLKGRLITCGVGKSGHIAAKAAATFASTGTPSFFLHASEAVHGDLGMVTADDIVLLLSYSGETDEVVRLFPSFQAIGARTIGMTGRVSSSVGRLADLTLDVWVEREVCPHNLAPTTSTVLMLAVCDALAVAVMEERDFQPDDFAKFHPAGALGKRLTLRVRDVMRRGDDLALVQEDAGVMDVLRTITRAGAGGACVINAEGLLVGFISDGDVRRHFLESDDPKKGIARELMTRNPMTFSDDLLAFEALEAFQTSGRKIGEMPVVDLAGRVLGLLVLKDLLRAGLV